MIQINLLPDVKIEYLKSRKMRGLVMSIGILVIVASITVVAFTAAYAYGVQKKQLADLDKSIKQNVASLNKIQDLNKILTVQNQLTSLDAIHSRKPAMTRLFTFLPQITPQNIQISALSVDYANNTMQIKGSGSSVEAVNKYVDTIKFTTFTTNNDPATSKKAFSSVVLSKISISTSRVDYTIDFNFDPQIFDITLQSVELTVPKITSTRSDLTVPNSLFKVELPTVTQSGTTN